VPQTPEITAGWHRRAANEAGAGASEGQKKQRKKSIQLTKQKQVNPEQILVNQQGSQ
jgi:hypothetical protein